MAVYGKYIQENNILLEFDIKESINNLKEKIIKIFTDLINNIQLKISQWKESKIKSKLIDLLNRAKRGLSKAKNVNSKDDFKDLHNEANDIKEEIKKAIFSPEFLQAVENKNILRVKIMIKDIMLVDKSLITYKAYLNYANSNIENLLDEHDGDELKEDQSDWTIDYLNSEFVKVVNNFSKERLKLLEKMVKYLYKEK